MLFSKVTHYSQEVWKVLILMPLLVTQFFMALIIFHFFWQSCEVNEIKKIESKKMKSKRSDENNIWNNLKMQLLENLEDQSLWLIYFLMELQKRRLGVIVPLLPRSKQFSSKVQEIWSCIMSSMVLQAVIRFNFVYKGLRN